MRDRLAGATALAALLLGAGASLAQQPVVIGGSGQPSVYVNTQVLNSLTPGFAPGSPYAPYTHGAYGYQQPGAFGQAAYGQPAYGQQPATIGGYYITRPSTLLFPPQQFPRSQVTVSPQQLAALRTAPATPSGSVELTPPSAAPAPGAVPSSMPSLPAPTASSPPSAPGQEQTDAAPRVPTIPAPIIPAPGAPDVPAADVGASAGRVPAIPPPSLPAPEPLVPEPLAPESLASKSPAPIPPAPTPPAPNPSAPEPPAPAEAAAAEPTGGGARGAPPPPSEDSVAEDGGELLAPPEPAPPAKAETRIAALPPASATAGPEGGKRLIFAEGTADLDEAAKQVLRAAAETLKTDQNARVQLLAYAGSDDESASRARRLSLSRALAVRQFLIKEGVRSTRMDVRALGSKFEDGPADRVDILPANR